MHDESIEKFIGNEYQQWIKQRGDKRGRDIKMMLFLGAGASKPFGIKTMDEMSEELENKMNEFTDDEKDLYQSIHNDLGTNNLEDILTVLNDLRKESGNPSVKYFKSLINQAEGPIFSPFGVRTKIKKSMSIPEIDLSEELWIALIRFIKENCIIKNDKRENIAKIYDEFFKIIENPIENSNSSPSHITINIFTTNYDRIIEEYFDGKGEELYDGFFFGNPWDPSSDYTGIIPGKKNYLFKLHGSIDYHSKGNEIVKGDNLSPTKTIDGTELKDLMIYPMREKEVYKDPFFTSLTSLKTNLLSEEICVVIGYSFGDEHIRNIFFDAVKRNLEIKIFMINPQAKKIRHDLEPIKDKIDTIEGKFGEKSVFEEFEEKLVHSR